MSAIKTLLIANRGEIAIRIARAADEMEIRSITVAPPDDAASLHLRHGDATHTLEGHGPAAYLDIGQIVAAAKSHDCDAVHPGYGFLSENAAFAQACVQAGLIFVGPQPETLALFGDKAAARDLARSLDVPLAEGTTGDTTLDAIRHFRAEQGPDATIMIKALAGGGGRGMRVVAPGHDVEEAFAICQAEALAAFGKAGVYAERYIARARHVEVQIVGDGEGGVAHLWDRECSLQRRHQKLVEIAPCPPLPGDLRERLLAASTTMAHAARYRGLGTFEFLVDPEAGEFFFLEANPRLQVEHTVTEAVTGIDLVQTQLAIAGGVNLEELGLSQDMIAQPHGFAVQARINAERLASDGSAIPSAGTLERFDMPGGPGLRVDTFGYAGYRFGAVYDSLLAKIIAHSNRSSLAAAMGRLARALSETRISGIETNIGLLRALLACDRIAEGDFHTRFIEENLSALTDNIPEDDRCIEAEIAVPNDYGADGGSEAEIPDGLTGIAAGMEGRIVQLDAAIGDKVRRGQQMAVIEAMKMQMSVTADTAGVVRDVCATVGDVLQAGAILFHLEPEEDTSEDNQAACDADPGRIRPELAELLDRVAGRQDEGRPAAVAKRHARGMRMIRENLAAFFDDAYSEYGGLTLAAQTSRRSREELLRMSPADGLVTAIGQVNSDRGWDDEATRCMALAYDYTVLAGTQGINSHHKIDRMLQLADQWRLPVMLFAEGGGGRPGDTDYHGGNGLNSPTFRRLAGLNGQVPLIGVVTGRCFAGNAALLGCCDVIIATRSSNIGMAGPAMIEGGGLGVVSPEEIGPASVQASNGVIDLLVADEVEAIARARDYLGYFQGDLAGWDAADQRLLRTVVPENRMLIYDIRRVINGLADLGSVLELRRDFAAGLLTCLVRIEGKPYGLIANDSRILGGAINAECADKAARFMQLCDAFGLPIVSLCDTPGFMVGPEAETKALVRHVSRMFITAAGLTVPILAVVLRKAYGLGAMAMTGGGFHAAATTLSWPTGEFGGMGLEGAVQLAYRKELAAAKEGAERNALFKELLDGEYERGKALNVAQTMEIDDVIDPVDTRARLVAAITAAGVSARKPSHGRIDAW